MAPVGMDTHELVSRAGMVAVVTGTTGWEAIQRGKPLITFVKNYFDFLGLSRVSSNVERLSLDIREEIERVSKISGEERKRRILFFLAAMLEHGFYLTHPNQFAYEPGTPEQYESGGIEMADALKKHLEYLKEEEHGALQHSR